MRKGLLGLFLFCLSFNLFSQSPTANFSVDPSSLEACVGDTIWFTDLSTTNGGPDIISWTWTFGDGLSSNEQNPFVIYANDGIKTVTLSVLNSSAEGSQIQETLTIYPIPDAGFTVLVNDCEAPFDVAFTNTSTTGAEYTYEWDFGNGETFTGSTPPTVSYDTDGIYTVTLTVTNTTTGCDAVYMDDIVVSTFVAGISAPIEACLNDIVFFNDNSTAGANSWTWSVSGPGGFTFQGGTTSSSQNPEISFSSAGTYTITLDAENTVSGCPISTIDHDILIHPLPTVSITTPVLTGCTGAILDFTISPYDATSTYEIDFGDATPPVTASSADVSHQFNLEGTFVVSISVVDENGCTASSTLSSIVIEQPDANFTADTRTGCAPLTVNFTNTSTALDPINDPIDSVYWDFDCDGVYDYAQEVGVDPDPSHIYTDPGRYRVCTMVVTEGKCVGYESKNRYIRVGSTVTIDFVATPLEACIKEPITFDASSILYDGHGYDEIDPSTGEPYYDEDDIEFEWTFGADDGGNNTASNGNSIEENIIQHSFALDTGWMDVTLVVTFRGCETELQKDNYVFIKPPKSQFVLSETNICNPGDGSFPITIDADAKGNHPDIVPVNTDLPTSWPDLSILGRADAGYTQFTDDIFVTWDWGDGNTTTFSTDGTGADFSLNADFLNNGSASHDYATYGEYTITQTIVNNTTGCDDETSQVLYITKVEPEFSFSNDSVCLNGSLSFDAFDGTTLSTTTGPIDETLAYLWDFQDGNPLTSTSEVPAVQFSIAGDDKVVDLEVTNVVGCSSTISKTIDVLELPSASITTDFPTNPICVDPSDLSSGDAQFSYTESIPSTIPIDPTQDAWNYGDGNTNSTGIHTYLTPNNTAPYTVTVSITDEFGCIGTGSTQVEATWPIPDFQTVTLISDTVCNNTPFQVVGTSSVATFNGTASYAWSGDPTISSVDTEDTFVTYNEATPDADLMEVNSLTYTVSDQNGCTDQITKDIVVSLPQANFTESFVALGDGEGCAPYLYTFDGTSSLSISNPAIYPWTYNWFFDNTDLGLTINTSSLDIALETFFPGNYETEFVFTDGYGCPDTTYTQFRVPGPSAAIGYVQSTDFCGQEITFTVTQDNPEFPIASGELYFGNGNSISFTGADLDPSCDCFTYTYIYTGQGTYSPYLVAYGGDTEACPVKFNFDDVVILDNGIDAGLEASTYEALIGENIVFTDLSTSTGLPIEEWTWEFLFEDTIVNQTGADVVYAFSSDSTHAVVLTVMAGGCYDNDTIYINIDGDILIPNVFTPNGDGGNNEWYVPGAPFKDYELLIFNRWGKKMYDYTGSGQPRWNGRNKGDGKLCKDGTYYYIVKGHLLNDVYIEKNGHITLLGGVD